MAKNDRQLNFKVSEENYEWLREKAFRSRRSLTGQLNILIDEQRVKENFDSNIGEVRNVETAQ